MNSKKIVIGIGGSVLAAISIVGGTIVQKDNSNIPELYVTICHWTGPVSGPTGGSGKWIEVPLGHRPMDKWHDILGYYPPDESKWEAAKLTSSVPGHDHDLWDFVTMNDRQPICSVPGSPESIDLSLPWIASNLYPETNSIQIDIPQCGCLSNDEWMVWGDAERGRVQRLKYAVFILKSAGELQ